jgi:transposase InsO family protein
MAQHGIRARHKRKYIATTNSNHSLPVAPNLLARNFTATAPNQGNYAVSRMYFLRFAMCGLAERHAA